MEFISSSCGTEQFKTALVEVYTPSMIAIKLTPVATLRFLKALALMVNQKFGMVFLGWEFGENRLLDYIGSNTKALYKSIYGRALDEKEVFIVLRKRFVFCWMTTFATILQIVFTISGVAYLTAVLAFFMLPLTYLDRQWATLVTKMAPRYERSLIIRVSLALKDACAPIGSIELPRRYRMHQQRFINLTNIEMFVGGIQVLTGTLILIYSLLIIVGWQDSDLQDQLADLALTIILIRIVKEMTNWVSPWIEFSLTATKYESNEKWFTDLINELMKISNGSIDTLDEKIKSLSEKEREHICRAARSLFELGKETVPFETEMVPIEKDAKPLTQFTFEEALPEHLQSMKFSSEQVSFLSYLFTLSISPKEA